MKRTPEASVSLTPSDVQRKLLTLSTQRLLGDANYQLQRLIEYRDSVAQGPNDRGRFRVSAEALTNMLREVGSLALRQAQIEQALDTLRLLESERSSQVDNPT